jgi:hypothetical protein
MYFFNGLRPGVFSSTHDASFTLTRPQEFLQKEAHPSKSCQGPVQKNMSKMVQPNDIQNNIYAHGIIV